MNLKLIPNPHPQVAATIADGQAVIVLADSGNVTILNETATRVWQLCDGTHTIEQIVQTIADEYSVEQSTAQQDVDNLLEQMLKLQALVIGEQE